MFRITLYSDATTRNFNVSSLEIGNELNGIAMSGYKQSDQYHNQKIVIVIEPITDPTEGEEAIAKLAQIAELAER